VIQEWKLILVGRREEREGGKTLARTSIMTHVSSHTGLEGGYPFSYVCRRQHRFFLIM